MSRRQKTHGTLSREKPIIVCICGERRTHIARAIRTTLFSTRETTDQLGADAHVCENPECPFFTDLAKVRPFWRPAPPGYAARI